MLLILAQRNENTIQNFFYKQTLPINITIATKFRYLLYKSSFHEDLMKNTEYFLHLRKSTNERNIFTNLMCV